ncbi:MAG TPA: HTTM domain-containing protein [Candidatus Limnocylindria bacterium]|nr:HTTM domain-containing protein [Candidatus Limnocylindria bacterium]
MRRDLAFWTGQTDVAPVALFRIVYGLLAINWFLQLLPNLTAFFTDEGMFPRASQVLFYPLQFTLLNVAGETWQVALFWIAALIAAVALALGFHSRTAAFVTFVMLASFSLRNPMIGDASDQVFRASALWLGFTAAGDRYSVDAWLRARRGDPPSGLGWALPVRILEVQFAWIYLATGLEKMGGGLWRDGLAVFYSLQLEHTFARPWAAPLARSVELTRAATALTLVTELGFLPLAFLPYVRRVGRIVAVVAAAGLHLSILLFMNVGNFPLIMLAGLIPFLPAGWVHRIAAMLRLPACEATASAVARASKWPRWAGGAALAVLALTIFSTSLPAYAAAPRPGTVDRMLLYADVVQKWNMFAPNPAIADGWMHIPAILADGTHVDLATGRPPSDEPLYADPLYSRWTKVTEWIAAAANADYRQEYSRMYCRLRNLHLQPGQSPIVSFDLVYYERLVPPPGGSPPPVRVVTLNAHHC